MPDPLEQESANLLQSWMRHDAHGLRDYLVSSVEDPRINLQSILTRHFLIRQLAPGMREGLMHEEYRFSAVMNWLLRNGEELADAHGRHAVLHGLRQGADNAEGLPLPYFLAAAFHALPVDVEGGTVPNYLAEFLTATEQPLRLLLESAVSNTFLGLWRRALAGLPPNSGRPRVFEPACGSANDYRFISACGLGSLLDYTGMDLCPKNVENARTLFPSIRFTAANVFALPATDREFDLCYVHDLFEHLSEAGLERAVTEVCRCTRTAICAGFFNMQERPEHVIQPHENYHWNTLSLERTRRLFAAHGFTGQAIHVGSFLNVAAGADETHNPHAYTLMLSRQG